ncbi:MAG: transglutaminase domain-containing protein [Candidatus Hodarchaeota archaeon]
MSEFREDLLISTINKKRVIGIILIVVLLISLFAFSSFLLGLIWGSQRPTPSDRLLEADEESVTLDLIPFPYNLSDFQNQFPNLTLDQLQDLFDMFDGDVDDFNLTSFSQTILPLLASEVEVFRIYDYFDFNSLSDNLWRYECFDEYTGDAWQSTAITQDYDFYTYSDYFNNYWWLDILRIQMPLTPSLGINSMVTPTLFPIPFIMEGSVNANNLDYNSIKLYKDSYNCTILNLNFTSSNPVNMSYELFGLDLPSDQDVNNSALDEDLTPDPIKNKFLQFPSSKQVYLSSHPFFESEYNILNNIIDQGDNAFEVANKIRNYLQANFTVGINALQNDPPANGEDVVEWFCEHREGLWPEFASAFTMFCRAFNVSSRYVDGFNSRGIIEEFDSFGSYVAIKYKNIYNWAEIYVPTDISGQGVWVQMEITPILDFNLQVDSEYPFYNRPSNVNLTATLTSSSTSIENRRITFYDETTQTFLGEALTDINGIASISVNINNSHVVGPHVITASYLTVINATIYTILGDAAINLTSLISAGPIPNEINISLNDPYPDEVFVQGYVYDPLNNERILNAQVNFNLFLDGTYTDVPNAFSPLSSYTDNNGDFSVNLFLNPFVIKGDYEVRVDFNGTWDLYGFPFTYPDINGSSNRMELDVVDETTFNLLFYIDNIEAWNYEAPSISRYSTIELKAIVINETGNPVQDQVVDFYDYSQNLYLGSDITNGSGIATYNYYIDNLAAGPNLVYVQLGSLTNYSYFILDAPITFFMDVWPQNREISRTGSTDRIFVIHGYLNDTENSKPVKFAFFNINMFDGPLDVASSYLNLVSGSYRTSNYGEIFAVFSVSSATPTKNYTLRISFNGYFDYTNPAPYFFNLDTYINFTTSSDANYELRVYDPEQVDIIFKIEGQHSLPFYDNGNPPATYNWPDFANFEVWINQSGTYAPAGSIVYLRDFYTNTLLASYTFQASDNGYHQFLISTSSLHAGLHQIRVRYENNSILYDTFNSTYVVINETININVNQNNLSILRDQQNFIISGTLYEGGVSLRGLIIKIMLLDISLNDNSSYLNLVGLQSIVINNDGTFQFTINSIDINCIQGPYYIRIDFEGSINAPGIDLINYMTPTNSSLRNIDVTAGTYLTQNTFYTEYESQYPNLWVDGDTLYVIGNLYWDNGTALSGVVVNVTVKLLDGTIVAYNDTVLTDGSGQFNASIYIDPSNPLWPTYRDQTEIWVYFDPIIHGMNYVEPSDIEFI